MPSILQPYINSPSENRRRRRRKRLRIVEYLLLAIGFVCLGIYGYSWGESHLYQSYEDYQLQCELERRQPTIMGYLQSLLTPEPANPETNGEERADGNVPKGETQPPPAPTPAPKPAPAIPPSGVIGRIEIPRVDVSAIVREGVDTRTLRRAAGHVPGTALPGQEGNVAVAAHRDTFFRGLRDIRQNDTIRMVTTHGTYEYLVRSTQIVKPNDVEVLDPDRPRELTLITCYPFNYIGHAPKRYIVKAEQVDAGPPAVFGEKAAVQAPSGATAKNKPSRTAAVHRKSANNRQHFRSTGRVARANRIHKRQSSD